MTNFSPVKNALQNAAGIAWDSCHKIYVLADSNQVEIQRSLGYEYIVTSSEETPDELLATIQEWFKQSCQLRFIHLLTTSEFDDSINGSIFTTLIPQQ